MSSFLRTGTAGWRLCIILELTFVVVLASPTASVSMDGADSTQPSNVVSGRMKSRNYHTVDEAECIDGLASGPAPKHNPMVRNIVKFLLPAASADKYRLANYETAAAKQCECYPNGTYRVRPPLLPDNSIALDKVFVTEEDLPAFSVDETYFIISAHIALKWKEVVVIIADHVSSDYLVSAAQRDHMRHGSEDVDVYCDFIDHRDTTNPNQKLFGPAQILAHHDDHHVRTIGCKLPDSTLACLTKPVVELEQPRCVDVALRTRPKGDHSAQALTVSLLQVCQFEKPERDDFLVTCTQPMNSHVFHLVAPWIEHHHNLGMERFYLYAEDLGLEAYVEPYIHSNLSEIRMWMDPLKNVFWPITLRPMSQVAAMNDCVYRLMDHAEWIAFFDVDEYFHPFKHSTLPPFFKDYVERDVGAVRIWTWYFAHEPPDDGAEMLLTANFKREEAVSDRRRSKNVIRASRVQIISVHEVMFGAKTEPLSEHDLRLNHYRAEYDGPVGIYDDGMKQYEAGLIAALQQDYGWWVPDIQYP